MGEHTRSQKELSEKKYEKYIGQRFGRLVVLSVVPEIRSRRNVLLQCVCDCGNLKRVAAPDLLAGKTKSCGCLRRDGRSHRYYVSEDENNQPNRDCVHYREFPIMAEFMCDILTEPLCYTKGICRFYKPTRRE